MIKYAGLVISPDAAVAEAEIALRGGYFCRLTGCLKAGYTVADKVFGCVLRSLYLPDATEPAGATLQPNSYGLCALTSPPPQHRVSEKY